VDPETLIWPKERGETVRSSSAVWPVMVVVAVLGLAFGGCGTLSSGMVSESSMLASRVPVVAPPVEPSPVTETVEAPTTSESSTPEADSTAAVAESAPTPTVSIDYQPITAKNAPAWVVALSGPADAALRGSPEAVPPDPDVEEYDPWEKFNEKMFTFNYNLDKYVLKPVAQGYNFVMPDMFQTMIDNAFTNLRMPSRFVNKVLQWKLLDATKEMGRFLINSTLGIGGLFDVARQEMGLERQRADFGQTLGIWGVGPGPYLVLPLMPPLTVRDGIGTGVDGAINPLYYYIPFWPDSLAMKIGDTINDRSLNLDLFQGIEESTVDLYSSVRNGYLQRRNRMIKEGR
ncbi:MAG TPA: VacJ family lipoprotein, partial [Methylomirabilota bacterium]